MIFNPNKEVKSLKGISMPKSFPSQEEIDKLPKGEDKQPDTDKLERETVGNIVMNCLSLYIPETKKDGYYINMIAQSILGFDEKKQKIGIEFKDKVKDFLVDVLDESTIRIEKVKGKDKEGKEKEEEQIKGYYSSWVTALIKEDLGVTIDDIEDKK